MYVGSFGEERVEVSEIRVQAEQNGSSSFEKKTVLESLKKLIPGVGLRKV